MPLTLRVYLASWVGACLLAVALVARNRRMFEFTGGAYLRFLSEPWKVVSFVLAAGFFVLAAPYTGDPYWDHVDGALMSSLTFITSPWVVGTLYRSRTRTAGWAARVYVSVVVWLLSASWCYDGYLLLRDGAYPRTWLANLLASSTLYGCAGLFWSVSYREGRGVTFAFLQPDWLAPVRLRRRALLTTAVVALLIAAAGVAAMWPYVIEVVERLESLATGAWFKRTGG